MQRLLHIGLLIALAILSPTLARAQTASQDRPADSLPLEARALDPPQPVPQGQAEQQLQALLQNARSLQQQQKDTQAAPLTGDQKKQLDLLQKQIETQQKMIELLVEQMKKQAPATTPLDKIQAQTAALEARSQRAAQRDQEMSQALDSIVEHQDSVERYGPSLPAQVKELFLPSGNNETPLSIYGALAFGYSRFPGDTASAANGAGRPATPGGFYFGEFTPDFFLRLNDWIFLEAELSVGPTGSVSAGAFAQADFFVTDWLTITAGRFVAPIGWFNERVNTPWVNKLPTDTPGSLPLLWLQVLPAMSLLGVQAQGSFYLGCSPLKLEYSAWVSNGLNFKPATAGMPNINELANLENMENTFNNITNEKALGGRLGLWWPAIGLAGGISGMTSGNYVAGGFEDAISLLAVDLNYHKGNWDVRLEYGMNWQQTDSFAGATGLTGNIRRQGFYGQVAYRPKDLPNGFLQKLEGVYRYSYVDFRGIDPTALDLTTFASPVDVPVRRQQSEFGINYYFYPRLVLKCAYQVNDEPGFHLHDNQFIAELDWGW